MLFQKSLGKMIGNHHDLLYFKIIEEWTNWILVQDPQFCLLFYFSYVSLLIFIFIVLLLQFYTLFSL